MAIELVTGHAGTAHVSSADAGALNAGIVGGGRYVLGTANGMAATMENANTITIATGDALFDGRHVRITSAESVTIDSGAQSMQRKDIVGIKYEIANSVESASLVVYKGTPVASWATDPTLPTGNILEGATTAFMPLYRVTINGISPEEPEQMFDVLDALHDYEAATDASMESLSSGIATNAANITTNTTNITTNTTNISANRTRIAALEAEHRGGTLVQGSTNVNYANNETWLVTLGTATKALVCLVWQRSNAGHVTVISGTPVTTEGSRWQVIPGTNVFGIYSQAEASVWSATKLN